jgi:hypothetical protein
MEELMDNFPNVIAMYEGRRHFILKESRGGGKHTYTLRGFGMLPSDRLIEIDVDKVIVVTNPDVEEPNVVY